MTADAARVVDNLGPFYLGSWLGHTGSLMFGAAELYHAERIREVTPL